MLNEIRFSFSIPCEETPNSINIKSDSLKTIFYQKVQDSWEHCDCYVLALTQNADGSKSISDGREIYQYLKKNSDANVDSVTFYLIEKTNDVSQAVFKSIGDLENLANPFKEFLNLDPLSSDLSYYAAIHFDDNGDFSRAYECLNKAANQGSVESMYCLSVFLKSGKGVDKDLDMALHWLQRAADAGHPEAMYAIGCYHKTDPYIALDWFQKAANAGHPKAMYALGCHHHVLSKDLDHIRYNPFLFGTANLLNDKQRSYSYNQFFINLETVKEKGIIDDVSEKTIDHLSEKIKAIYWLVHSEMKGYSKAKVEIQKLESQPDIFYTTYLSYKKIVSRVREGGSIDQILKEQKDEESKIRKHEIELADAKAKLEKKTKSENIIIVSDQINPLDLDLDLGVEKKSSEENTLTNNINFKEFEPRARTTVNTEINIEKEKINNTLFTIAECYFYGYIYCQNYKKAFDLLKLCENYIPSYKLLGDCYRYGYSIKSNIEIAMEYYQLAIRHGCKESMDCFIDLKIERLRSELAKTEKQTHKNTIYDSIYQIASRYFHGFTSCGNTYPKNYQKAIELLKLCEEHAPSLKLLGDCYRHGYSVEVNLNIAGGYYKSAIEKGCKESIFIIDEINLEFLLSKLPKAGAGAEAEPVVKKINELIFEMASYYFNGCTHREYFYPADYERAIKFLNCCVDYPPSFKLLGDCYRYGFSVQVDREKAKGFYERAADKGCAESFDCFNNLIVEEFLEELATTQDPNRKEAINSLIHKIACCYLYGLTYRGHTYPKNGEQAFMFLNCCMNYIPSLKLLGDCYSGGISVEVDREKAKEFYERAADKGCPESMECLFQLRMEKEEEEWLRSRSRPEPESKPPAKRRKRE